MLAATVKLEKAGAQEYQNDHMGRIFDEGFSFSGFERDKLYLNDRGGTFVDISGLSGLDAVTDGRGAAYAHFLNDGVSRSESPRRGAECRSTAPPAP